MKGEGFMTANEMIFLLLRESLFSEIPNNTVIIEDTDLWEKVYQESKDQSITGLIATVAKKHPEIPEHIVHDWEKNQLACISRFIQIAYLQNEICSLLDEVEIEAAVIKGMAAAISYPSPELRTMGDIDILVRPESYRKAIQLLREHEFRVIGEEEGIYHVVFKKYGVLIELHKSPAGIHRDKKGEIIKKYILSGLKTVEIKQIGKYQFPFLPWKQNGMELIWHIRQHLYNGLGLRQIIDWMMFVYCYLDDERMIEYMPDLRNCGLDQLAINVTKMCQKYLGLPKEHITWCDSADEEDCDNLMNFIMEQGDFGKKVLNEKTIRVISGYSNPIIMFRKLQSMGEKNWGILKKAPFLTPFAFIYAGGNAFLSACREKGSLVKLMDDIRRGKKRIRMFSRLNTSNDSVKEKLETGSTHKNIHKREIIRKIVRTINRTRAAFIAKKCVDIVSMVEYHAYDFACFCKGYRMPTKEEREFIRNNVTFIYKSFERQKMAIQLYDNIQHFYPGSHVIIADDSKVPLKIYGKDVTVINLPFNTGLSYGLNKALQQVKTQYVVRLDDDCLLTRRTLLGEQLRFLNEHTEIDLVSFCILNALRLERPEQHIRKLYPQSMNNAPKRLKIAHLTRVDENHIVLGKGPNLFLIKTEMLKQVGYDDNIRMIDHDDFFYRAAGNLVSVVAEETRIFHRHNLFDKNYNKYRNDIVGDLIYIRGSRHR